MLAASENGPRGTSVNVSMLPITPRPPDISGLRHVAEMC